MTNGYVGYMVSRATPWFKIQLENKRLEKSGQVRLFLQNTEKALYRELENSNFYEKLPTLFKSGSGIGTGYSSVEEDYDNNISVVITHHFKSMFVAHDKYGNLVAAFREFELSHLDICRTWEDTVPKEIVEAKKTNRYAKKKIYHAVVLNDDWDPNKQSTDKKRFKSYYYIDGFSTLLSESGYEEMPFISWMWRKEEGEDYGRGKGHDALVMLRRSNLIAETLDMSAELAVKPPIQYHKDVEDVIDLTPDGMNPYEDPEKIIMPVELGKNYPIGRDREEMYNTLIREIFHVDFFLALRNKTKQMTARS